MRLKILDNLKGEPSKNGFCIYDADTGEIIKDDIKTNLEAKNFIKLQNLKQLKLQELKNYPVFKLQDMFRKEKNFNYKCRITKAIKIIQNKDNY